MRPLTLRERWDQVRPEEIIPGCIPDNGKVEKSKRTHVSETDQDASVTVPVDAVTTEPNSFLNQLPRPAQPAHGQEHCTSFPSRLPMPVQSGRGQICNVVEQDYSRSADYGKTMDKCRHESGLSGSFGTSRRPMEHRTYGSSNAVDSNACNVGRLCSSVQATESCSTSTCRESQILANSSIYNVSHSSLSVPAITMRRPMENRAHSSSCVVRESLLVVDRSTYKASCQSSAISTRRPQVSPVLISDARVILSKPDGNELATGNCIHQIPGKCINASGFLRVEMSDFVSSLNLITLQLHDEYV